MTRLARAIHEQGSVVGIWSFAIWSLVRVFGAATDCRHLSFAGPRPSGKVRSFAPKNDRLATERRSATPRWPRRVSFFLLFQKCNPHLFTQPLLTAEPMHPPAHSQTAFVGWCRAAVPTLSGANIDSGAIPVPVFAPGSGNSTTRRRRVV